MYTLLKLLDDLNISYKKYEHPALFTVDEAEKIDATIPGLHCKNLFLKDKKGKYFLFSTLAKKEIDIKLLRSKIGCAGLSFASADRLKEILDLSPGSVCPFGLMNDKDNKVTMVLDKDLVGQDIVNFHPLINTATIGLSSDDLLKFIEYTSNDFMEVEL